MRQISPITFTSGSGFFVDVIYFSANPQCPQCGSDGKQITLTNKPNPLIPEPADPIWAFLTGVRMVTIMVFVLWRYLPTLVMQGDK